MTINEFIDSKYQKGLDIGIKTEAKLNKLKDYYGSNINESIYNRFMMNPNYDFINENLQSHDYRLLKSKLLERFSKYIVSIDTFYNEKDEQEMIIIKTSTPGILIKSSEFNNLLDFYGYYYTSSRKADKGFFFIYIEPKYAKKCNDYIYKDCHGIVYHLTDNDSADRILDSSLRMRNSKNGEDPYRKFPKRIYFYANPEMDWDMLESLSDEVLGLDFDYEVSILRINVKGSNINFYKDVGIGNPDCYYCYSNIPKKWIKRI